MVGGVGDEVVVGGVGGGDYGFLLLSWMVFTMCFCTGTSRRRRKWRRRRRRRRSREQEYG